MRFLIKTFPVLGKQNECLNFLIFLVILLFHISLSLEIIHLEEFQRMYGSQFLNSFCILSLLGQIKCKSFLKNSLVLPFLDIMICIFSCTSSSFLPLDSTARGELWPPVQYASMSLCWASFPSILSLSSSLDLSLPPLAISAWVFPSSLVHIFSHSVSSLAFQTPALFTHVHSIVVTELLRIVLSSPLIHLFSS